ncbi:RNA polymerase sigma factor [Rhizobium gallicum]|uniref:RNA polymerase sigma factor n=1 Tax=Rhizobium gallicum TaxID=56730 RepID=UPI001EF863BC|nr:RNA polymerase sigma factor [Rhizobium gallicum]ULJ72651.1 RNA polymerase sigma factor [Rhizobium gallicum]
MTDIAWIDVALIAARPKALGALLRYFRDLDIAEEAFQEACLRAIRTWPDKGPPRDPIAWLIFVGRNSGIDAVRKQAKTQALPDEDLISDKEDTESDIADRLDESNYRDDILRLLFICCHPDLPATQQIALALRIVSGLSVQQIARAFLVGESAMEQRITRAKARVAKAGVPFETPGPEERAQRLSIVSTMIYLIFNEGYSQGDPKREAAAFSDEAIRLGRLLLRIFPGEPEIMGLLALMLLQISRRDARFDANGELVLLEDQDRSRWNHALINEALNLLDKAIRHRRPGPYQLQAAIAAIHSRAKRAEDTDWEEIDLLYRVLERLQPSPVVTLNRAVAISKLKGPEEALRLVETLGEKLDGYFYYHGLRGGLLKQMGRAREAREAFDRAIALANSAAEAAHIRLQIDKLQSEPAHPVAK